MSHVDESALAGGREKRPGNRREGVGLCAWWGGQECSLLQTQCSLQDRRQSCKLRVRKWGSRRLKEGRLGEKHVAELMRGKWLAC